MRRGHGEMTCMCSRHCAARRVGLAPQRTLAWPVKRRGRWGGVPSDGRRAARGSGRDEVASLVWGSGAADATPQLFEPHAARRFAARPHPDAHPAARASRRQPLRPPRLRSCAAPAPRFAPLLPHPFDRSRLELNSGARLQLAAADARSRRALKAARCVRSLHALLSAAASCSAEWTRSQSRRSTPWRTACRETTPWVRGRATPPPHAAERHWAALDRYQGRIAPF